MEREGLRRSSQSLEVRKGGDRMSEAGELCPTEIGNLIKSCPVGWVVIRLSERSACS